MKHLINLIYKKQSAAIAHTVDNWTVYQNNLSTIRSSFENPEVIHSTIDRIEKLFTNNPEPINHREL